MSYLCDKVREICQSFIKEKSGFINGFRYKNQLDLAKALIKTSRSNDTYEMLKKIAIHLQAFSFVDKSGLLYLPTKLKEMFEIAIDIIIDPEPIHAPPKRELDLKYYKILGISRDVPIEKIKTAYRDKIKFCHPDKNIDKEKATIETAEVNEAYKIICSFMKYLDTTSAPIKDNYTAIEMLKKITFEVRNKEKELTAIINHLNENTRSTELSIKLELILKNLEEGRIYILTGLQSIPPDKISSYLQQMPPAISSLIASAGPTTLAYASCPSSSVASGSSDWSSMRENLGSMKNQVGKNQVGYIEHYVADDGNCGFTAFGITREHAFQLLKEHVADKQMIVLIRLAVESALLTDDFCNYLKNKELINRDISFDEIRKNIKNWAQDLPVVAAYLTYDIKDSRIDAGWAHPSILQALAHIRGIKIRMWSKGQDMALRPHRISEEDYSCYTPNGYTSIIDLLFINRNHFNRVDLIGYDDVPPNTLIYPFNSSWNQNLSASGGPIAPSYGAMGYSQSITTIDFSALNAGSSTVVSASCSSAPVASGSSDWSSMRENLSASGGPITPSYKAMGYSQSITTIDFSALNTGSSTVASAKVDKPHRASDLGYLSPTSPRKG